MQPVPCHMLAYSAKYRDGDQAAAMSSATTACTIDPVPSTSKTNRKQSAAVSGGSDSLAGHKRRAPTTASALELGCYMSHHSAASEFTLHIKGTDSTKSFSLYEEDHLKNLGQNPKIA